MTAFAFRIMAISLMVSLFIVPLYAHHGSQLLSRAMYSIAELRRDLDTSDFAMATLPMMRQHLQNAEDIQKQLQPR